MSAGRPSPPPPGLPPGTADDDGPDPAREPLPLFVYGTLLKPSFLGHMLERPVTGTAARLDGFEVVVVAGLPTVVEAEGGAVEGRLYLDLSAEDYRRLDAYEGVAEGLYQRVEVAVSATGGGDAAPAYLYRMTDQALDRNIRSGDRERVRRAAASPSGE